MAYGSISTSAAGSATGWPRWLLNDRRAWYVWLAFVCAIAAVVVDAPDYRTVTPNYRDASFHWFAGRAIYTEGKHGFLYFPQAAILFSPFAYLPSPTGEVLWRMVSIGGLALAIWRWASLSGVVGHRVFFLMTLLTIPPAVASARNGQMNLVLTALTALAFVELAHERWRAAACWLCLGAAMKPLTIVPIAVAFLVYRPVRRPVMLGAAALLVFPFFTQQAGYVCDQYHVCLQKLLLAGNPGEANPVSDLFGLLSAIGWTTPLPVQTVVRALAGGLTVVLAWLVVRRRETIRAARSVLALTTCYLALFNPRMENNGFVVIAPALAGLAAGAFLNPGRRPAGWLMVAASLGIAGSYEITRGYNFWLCPLLALSVWGYAVFDALSGGCDTTGESTAGPPAPNGPSAIKYSATTRPPIRCS